jgi:hypothetical protein
MMSVEITGVSQCRGGLAPAVSLKASSGQAARAAAMRRVPCAAISGSQACPVVMTACRCRRIAAAATVFAWVGASVLPALVVRCW